MFNIVAIFLIQLRAIFHTKRVSKFVICRRIKCRLLILELQPLKQRWRKLLHAYPLTYTKHRNQISHFLNNCHPSFWHLESNANGGNVAPTPKVRMSYVRPKFREYRSKFLNFHVHSLYTELFVIHIIFLLRKTSIF